MTALLPGRPVNAADREPVERACYDFLDGLGVAYERVDHDAAFTLEACKEVDGALGATICKYLSAQLGCARLSFAPPEDMERLLGVTPGSATVLGLMNDKEKVVQLVIDRSAVGQEYFGCHPCRNTTSLRFRTADLLEKVIPALDHSPVLVDLPDGEDA